MPVEILVWVLPANILKFSILTIFPPIPDFFSPLFFKSTSVADIVETINAFYDHTV